MAKILGVTLARGGSKGLPNKHLLDLCGKPVIAWTVEAAMQSKHLNWYVGSTDDHDIATQFVIPGHISCIRRPPELAQDDTPTLPALQHAVEVWEQANKETYDYIIEIRATSPLKTTDDIDRCIEMLIESGADSVIGVTELSDHHPARAKWLDGDGRIHDFLAEPSNGRRQDLTPKAFIRNGTIYALRRSAVMGEHGKLFGHENSLAYVMPSERSVNLDEPLDLKLCELLMKERGEHGI